jgi:3-keto-5-aminohexanoate cleavage enzyme
MEYTIQKAQESNRDDMLRILSFFNMHNIPSPEMEEFNYDQFLIAKVGGKIVGLAGWKVISPGEGKTTLMAVLPEYSGSGIGKDLQHRRMKILFDLGCKTILTNADRPETILWYKVHFGYKEIGTLKKLCSFGLDDVDSWTTIKSDLIAYFNNYEERQKIRTEYMGENDAYPLTPYPPLLINVCLSGMVPRKSISQFVPETVDEIVEDAIQVYDSGARIIHIHARDKQGEPTPEVRYYDKIIRAIRKERPGMICCTTTSGRNWPEFEKRSAAFYLDKEARPDMASLTTGSLNFITGPSVSSITMIERLAMAMKEQGVKPELEVFDLGMINMIKYLERNQFITGTKYINIMLGNINSAPATIMGLNAMVEQLPKNSVWAAAGLGQFQLPMNMAAMLAGGHVRVGIEDSIYYDTNKNVLASNKKLVERVVRIAEELERPIATAEQARAMLGL